MKKILAALLVTGSALSLSACGGIPKCNDELNECGRDTAYTEERTVKGDMYRTVLNKQPEPAPVIVEERKVVVETTPPPPPPVVDTKIMTTAEPQFKQISK